MATTNYRGYTVPAATGAAPAGATQIRALASDIDLDVEQLDRGMRLLTTIVQTSDGTFLKSSYPGIKAIEIEAVGGAGGTGGCDATSALQVSHGGGGCSGQYGRKFLLESSGIVISQVYGAGGNAGTFYVGQSGSNTTITDGASLTLTVRGGSSAAHNRYTSLSTAFRSIGGTAANLPSDAIGAWDYVAGCNPSYQGIITTLACLSMSVGGEAPVLGMRSKLTATASAVTTQVAPAAPATGAYGSGGNGGFNLVSQSAQDGAAGHAGVIIIKVYV